jgi:hypothetical protein
VLTGFDTSQKFSNEYFLVFNNSNFQNNNKNLLFLLFSLTFPYDINFHDFSLFSRNVLTMSTVIRLLNMAVMTEGEDIGDWEHCYSIEKIRFFPIFWEIVRCFSIKKLGKNLNFPKKKNRFFSKKRLGKNRIFWYKIRFI